jgi:selenocysteine lyase/cysteine desulfurase
VNDLLRSNAATAGPISTRHGEAAKPLNWQFARYLTSGCNDIIHLNNAGAALMPNCVVEAAIKHLRDEARLGAYEAAERAHAAIDHVYDSSAILLNCLPSEIAVVENASRAWNLAFGSIKFMPEDVVVTTSFEYANNYLTMMQARRRFGVRIAVVPNAETGELSLEALKAIIAKDGKNIRLISITHVPTHNGVVNPVVEAGMIVRATKACGLLSPRAIYIVDACQSVGQMDIDVQEGAVDIMTTCSRKYLRGPRGIGLLFVRKGLLDPRQAEEPLLLDVRAAGWTSREGYVVYDDGRRFETWDTNLAGKIALGVAIDHACTWGLTNIEAYIGQLAEKLRTLLRGIPRVRVHDVGTRRCGIVSFSVDGSAPADLRAFLTANGINVGISERALTRLDMEQRQLHMVLRASVHYYNFEHEIIALVERIEEFCRLKN